MTTTSRVFKVVDYVLTPEQITLGSHIIDDLGADSLDMMELIMKIEEEFGVTVNDEDAAKIETVADIVELVER